MRTPITPIRIKKDDKESFKAAAMASGYKSLSEFIIEAAREKAMLNKVQC